MRHVVLWVSLALLTASCVPKKKHLEAIDALDGQLIELRHVVGMADERVTQLERELAGALAREALLDGISADLERDNAELLVQLQEFSASLSEMSARNKKDKERKAELEATISSLQTRSEEAGTAVAEARSRIETLEDEASRLRAEKEALEAETQEYTQLLDSLKDEIDQGLVTITELSGKLTVNLSNAILFDSGSYSLKEAGKTALDKVAEVLAAQTNREVRVEGHTDNDPVKPGARYADNWALSGLRASAVVSRLVQAGVDPLNAAAMGYGEYRPIDTNETEEGQANNRRTEIVLVPRLIQLD